MTKDLTTIIEEWIEKDYYIIDGVRVKDGMEGVHNECLDHLKSKIPQLVEEIANEIESRRQDAEKHPMKYSDDTEMKEYNKGYDHALRELIKSLTGKNI